jgi:hypothetical protein
MLLGGREEEGESVRNIHKKREFEKRKKIAKPALAIK